MYETRGRKTTVQVAGSLCSILGAVIFATKHTLFDTGGYYINTIPVFPHSILRTYISRWQPLENISSAQSVLRISIATLICVMCFIYRLKLHRPKKSMISAVASSTVTTPLLSSFACVLGHQCPTPSIQYPVTTASVPPQSQLVIFTTSSYS